jgi:hypothetical protein
VRRAFPGGRARTLLGVLAALATTAAVLGANLFPAAADAPPSGPLQLAQGTPSAPGMYVAGDDLYGPAGPNAQLRAGAQKLAAPASSPLVGGDGPVAAPSPDGQTVAYSTWTWTRAVDWTKSFDEQGIANDDPLGTPTLRLHDTRTSTDTALEPGTFDASWRPDGALAYILGDPPEYRADSPYLGNVLVRASATAAPVAWTQQADRYRVFGWAAGNRLVVVRGLEGGPPDVEVLDGPGQVRMLAAGAGMLGLSPDGSQALVSTGDPGHGGVTIGLRSVADSSQLASLSLSTVLDPVTGHPLEWISGPASWRGDRVLVGSSSGLVVLRVSSSSVSVEQVMHVGLQHDTAGSLYEPRFADDTGRTIVWWADLPGDGAPQSAQFVCDRLALTCTRAAPVPAVRAPRPVYDLSGGSR